MVDSYARMQNGPTWETMREARSLPNEVQTTPTEEETFPPVEEDKRGLCELSDAPAVVAIEHDTEVQETHASIHSLRKILAFPDVANAPHGQNTERGHFARMPKSGLWIPHPQSYKGNATYFSKIICGGTICDINSDGFDTDAPALSEVVNMDSLGRYDGETHVGITHYLLETSISTFCLI